MVRRRAALILEVVISLTIFVLASGFLAAELINGMRMTGQAEAQMRANQLADRMLALLELDPNLTAQLTQEQTTHGDFGKSNPRWFWRATVEPVINTTGLGLVTLELLWQPDPNKADDYETASVVRHLHTLKAAPGRIDLAKDFGVDQEAVDQLSQTLPIAGFDPTQLDPQAIAAMDPQTLMALLPALMQLLPQLGGGNVSPEMLSQLLGGLNGGALPGGSGQGGSGQSSGNPQRDAIAAMIKQALGGQIDDAQLQQLLNSLPNQGGGGQAQGPGGGRGGQNGGGQDPQQQMIRDFLRSQLNGQVSDADLEQMMNNIGRNGGGFAPPPGAGFTPGGGRGNLGGGQNGGGRGNFNGGQNGGQNGGRGNGGRGGGQTINQINNSRDTANPGKKSSSGG